MSTNTNNHKLSGNINSLSNKHQLPPTTQPQPQQHQTNINSTVQNQQQIIPPRYQPPPQPPGGILKNIPSSKTVSSYYTSEQNGGPQLKYPPDVPKVAAVYIPESVRTANPKVIPSRLPNYRHSTGQVLSQPQQQHTQIQIHQPPLQQNTRLISEENQNHRQPQQSQEMLKFVRKPENETGVPTNANAGRLSAEQNRHLQVSVLVKLLNDNCKLLIHTFSSRHNVSFPFHFYFYGRRRSKVLFDLPSFPLISNKIGNNMRPSQKNV